MGIVASDAPYMRLALGGVLPGAEKWRTVQWWKFTEGVPAHGDFVNSASDVYVSFANNMWNATTGTKWLTKNVTGSNISTYQATLYVDGAIADETTQNPGPIAGSVAAGASPGYTAACFTLATARFGRSFRGRAYLPHTASVVNATLQLDVDSTCCANFARYLNKTGVVLDGVGTVPVVMSQTLGQSEQITQVRLDTIPDTQHGRDRQLSATNRFSNSV